MCACVCVCVCVCVHYASTLKVVKVFRSPLANIPEDQLHNTWIKHSHTQGFFKLMNKKNPNKRDQFHREMLYFSENISVANISRSNTSAQHTSESESSEQHAKTSNKLSIILALWNVQATIQYANKEAFGDHEQQEWNSFQLPSTNTAIVDFHLVCTHWLTIIPRGVVAMETEV